MDRCPEGSTTVREACLTRSWGMLRGVRRPIRRLLAGLGDFACAQNLAVLAITAYLGARQHDLKTEMRFDLPPDSLKRLAEELFHFAASQADHVRVLLLSARLVVVLVAAIVHQVQLIHQTAFLQQLQRAIDSDAVELGVLLLGHLKQVLGVKMLAGFVDKLEQNLTLA